MADAYDSSLACTMHVVLKNGIQSFCVDLKLRLTLHSFIVVAWMAWYCMAGVGERSPSCWFPQSTLP